LEFSESGSIDRIIIHDHGFVGGIMGDGEEIGLYTMYYVRSKKMNNGAETTETFADAVNSGKINIAQNGSIVIFGCNCSEIARELSRKLGAVFRYDVTVTGANNAVWEKMVKQSWINEQMELVMVAGEAL
jgi:hypothetical protein